MDYNHMTPEQRDAYLSYLRANLPSRKRPQRPLGWSRGDSIVMVTLAVIAAICFVGAALLWQ